MNRREYIMKHMKKLALLGLTAVMSLSLLAGCGGTTGNAETPDAGETTPATESQAPAGETTPAAGEFTTVEAGKLHMSTNAAFPPYEMIKDDGTFEGIDVEVAAAIAEELGLELVVDDMGFDAALLAAQNGQSDMVMAGVTVTEERQAVMDFSESYATGVQVVIVKEDSPIQTVDDLATAEMIGTQVATTGYIYCSDTPENGGYGEDHVTAYESGALAVQALINGKVDAVVIDNAPAQEFVAANEGLKILDTEFAVEDYAIGVKKGNTALLDAINGALNKLIEDGTVQSIVDKYIAAE